MIDILFSLAGLVILIKGKVQITESRIVTGKSVRILGVLYLLCFPMGYMLRYIILQAGYDKYILLGFIYPLLLIILTIIFVFAAKPTPPNQK